MPKRNIVWIMVLLVIALLLWRVPEVLIRRDTLYTQFSPLLDVLFQVRKNYVEEPKVEVLLHGAIDGMLSKLDPYSRYFDADEYRQYQRMTDGQFEGIGIEVGRAEGGGLLVVSPIEGSPAYKAGLKAEDRILKIDGTPTAGMKTTEAIQLMQGKPGTSVTLTIERTGLNAPFDVSITRGVITDRTVRGWARSANWDWDYLIDPAQRIGYVWISDFKKPTEEQLDEVFHELLTKQHIRALIIDLRDNPGGLLDVVTNMAGHFIERGVIVTTRGRNSVVTYEAAGKNVYPDLPLAVLINQNSASAAEILAGSLQDYGRATLVGERSFGKGSVQEMVELTGGRGAVKLTTAKYYLPKGVCIHGKGVTPDRVVPLTPEEHAAWKESRDRVYLTSREVTASAPTSGPAPATSSAPATTSAPARVEVMIDRQLAEALAVVRAQLATRPAD